MRRIRYFKRYGNMDVRRVASMKLSSTLLKDLVKWKSRLKPSWRRVNLGIFRENCKRPIRDPNRAVSFSSEETLPSYAESFKKRRFGMGSYKAFKINDM